MMHETRQRTRQVTGQVHKARASAAALGIVRSVSSTPRHLALLVNLSHATHLNFVQIGSRAQCENKTRNGTESLSNGQTSNGPAETGKLTMAKENRKCNPWRDHKLLEKLAV